MLVEVEVVEQVFGYRVAVVIFWRECGCARRYHGVNKRFWHIVEEIMLCRVIIYMNGVYVAIASSPLRMALVVGNENVDTFVM